MPIELAQIRDLLLPGLREVTGSYRTFNARFPAPPLATPYIWVPKLSIPETIAVGAAAVIIKNPTLTRRFWSGWRVH